ncbi:hypothetical protein HY627_02280 [Candidatus Uhrbacteria bacterium]|nr:hypothetical protein [Candidatus Uhrbacteria bacterium]
MRIITFLIAALLWCAGCAVPVATANAPAAAQTASPLQQTPCITGQVSCGQVSMGQEDEATLDLLRLGGLTSQDASQVFGSKLASALDGLTAEELDPVGITHDQIGGVTYELIPVFTKLRSTNAVVPVFNTEILANGLRVAIQKPQDEEASKKLFAALPYTREQFVEVIKGALRDYEVMTGLPAVIVESEDTANLLIGISDTFFEQLGAAYRYAPGYSDADEGGFEMKESLTIGTYLRIKGRRVILNPLKPKDLYADSESARLYAFFSEDVIKALFFHEMRVVTLQEITHSTCYAGGWGREGLGHTSTITSIMYSGTDGAIDYDVRTRGASESLSPNETQLLVREGKRYVVRSRLAPLREDVAGMMVRALRAVVKKFGLAS